MKKFLVLAVLACTAMTSAFAQLRVEAGFINGSVQLDDNDVDMSGIKLGGYYMLNDLVIEKSVVEAGLTMQINSGKAHGVKHKHMDFAIPVNAGYKIVINDDMSVRPYVGINLKLNTKYDWKFDGITTDMLDGDDVTRFQFGAQFGGVFQWKQFTAGYQYQFDFNDIFDEYKCKFPNNAITVGMIF